NPMGNYEAEQLTERRHCTPKVRRVNTFSGWIIYNSAQGYGRRKQSESDCEAGEIFRDWIHHPGRGASGVFSREAAGLLAAHKVDLHSRADFWRGGGICGNDPDGDGVVQG